jgi:putative mycofactocin binding protein MftB
MRPAHRDPALIGGARLRLDPRVAIRPEPFGALAFHSGTRRLIFHGTPEMVYLGRCLGAQPSTRAALEACGIDERRWPSFATALASLAASDVLEPVEP